MSEPSGSNSEDSEAEFFICKFEPIGKDVSNVKVAVGGSGRFQVTSKSEREDTSNSSRTGEGRIVVPEEKESSSEQENLDAEKHEGNESQELAGDVQERETLAGIREKDQVSKPLSEQISVVAEPIGEKCEKVYQPITEQVEEPVVGKCENHNLITEQCVQVEKSVAEKSEEVFQPVTEQALEVEGSDVGKGIEIHEQIAQQSSEVEEPVTEKCEDVNQPVTKQILEVHQPFSEQVLDDDESVIEKCEQVHKPITEHVLDIKKPLTEQYKSFQVLESGPGETDANNLAVKGVDDSTEDERSDEVVVGGSDVLQRDTSEPGGTDKTEEPLFTESDSDDSETVGFGLVIDEEVDPDTLKSFQEMKRDDNTGVAGPKGSGSGKSVRVVSHGNGAGDSKSKEGKAEVMVEEGGSLLLKENFEIGNNECRVVKLDKMEDTSCLSDKEDEINSRAASRDPEIVSEPLAKKSEITEKVSETSVVSREMPVTSEPNSEDWTEKEMVSETHVESTGMQVVSKASPEESGETMVISEILSEESMDMQVVPESSSEDSREMEVVSESPEASRKIEEVSEPFPEERREKKVVSEIPAMDSSEEEGESKVHLHESKITEVGSKTPSEKNGEIEMISKIPSEENGDTEQLSKMPFKENTETEKVIESFSEENRLVPLVSEDLSEERRDTKESREKEALSELEEEGRGSEVVLKPEVRKDTKESREKEGVSELEEVRGTEVILKPEEERRETEKSRETIEVLSESAEESGVIKVVLETPAEERRDAVEESEPHPEESRETDVALETVLEENRKAEVVSEHPSEENRDKGETSDIPFKESGRTEVAEPFSEESRETEMVLETHFEERDTKNQTESLENRESKLVSGSLGEDSKEPEVVLETPYEENREPEIVLETTKESKDVEVVSEPPAKKRRITKLVFEMPSEENAERDDVLKSPVKRNGEVLLTPTSEESRERLVTLEPPVKQRKIGEVLSETPSEECSKIEEMSAYPPKRNKDKVEVSELTDENRDREESLAKGNSLEPEDSDLEMMDEGDISDNRNTSLKKEHLQVRDSEKNKEVTEKREFKQSQISSVGKVEPVMKSRVPLSDECQSLLENGMEVYTKRDTHSPEFFGFSSPEYNLESGVSILDILTDTKEYDSALESSSESDVEILDLPVSPEKTIRSEEKNFEPVSFASPVSIPKKRGATRGRPVNRNQLSRSPSVDLSSANYKKPFGRGRSTQSRNRSSKSPSVNLSSDEYKIPFEHGWKREIVYRSTVEDEPRRQRVADAYYYPPTGKKLRSARELEEYLSSHETDLQSKNFTFCTEPLGVKSEWEIVREAKKKEDVKHTVENKVEQSQVPLPPLKKRKIVRVSLSPVEDENKTKKDVAVEDKKKTKTDLTVENENKTKKDPIVEDQTKTKKDPTPVPPRKGPKIKITQSKAELKKARENAKSVVHVSKPVFVMGTLPPGMKNLESSDLSQMQKVPSYPKVNTASPVIQLAAVRPHQTGQLRHFPETMLNSHLPEPTGRKPKFIKKLIRLSLPKSGPPIYTNPPTSAVPTVPVPEIRMAERCMVSSVNTPGVLPPNAKVVAHSSASTTAVPSAPLSKIGKLPGDMSPCSLTCPGLTGVVPSLPCSVCQCLCHPECVVEFGSTASNFLCTNCRSTRENFSHSSQSALSVTVVHPQGSSHIRGPPPLHRILPTTALTSTSTTVVSSAVRLPTLQKHASVSLSSATPHPGVTPVGGSLPQIPPPPPLVRVPGPNRAWLPQMVAPVPRSVTPAKGTACEPISAVTAVTSSHLASLAKAVTTWIPPSGLSPETSAHKASTSAGQQIQAQAVANIGGKKFIVVPRSSCLDRQMGSEVGLTVTATGTIQVQSKGIYASSSITSVSPEAQLISPPSAALVQPLGPPLLGAGQNYAFTNQRGVPLSGPPVRYPELPVTSGLSVVQPSLATSLQPPVTSQPQAGAVQFMGLPATQCGIPSTGGPIPLQALTPGAPLPGTSAPVFTHPSNPNIRYVLSPQPLSSGGGTLLQTNKAGKSQFFMLTPTTFSVNLMTSSSAVTLDSVPTVSSDSSRSATPTSTTTTMHGCRVSATSQEVMSPDNSTELESGKSNNTTKTDSSSLNAVDQKEDSSEDQMPGEKETDSEKMIVEVVDESPSPSHVQDRSEKKQEMQSHFCKYFVSNMSSGYYGLLRIFRHLTVQELLRAACVCHLWKELALHPSLWQTVRLKNSKVQDWHGFSEHVTRARTKHLDMRKMLFASYRYETWYGFLAVADKLTSVKQIDFCRCPTNILEAIVEKCPWIEVINAQSLCTSNIELNSFQGLTQLKDMRLKSIGGLNAKCGTWKVYKLTQLQYLSLTTFKDLDPTKLQFLKHLENLQTLELGECTHFKEDMYEILSHLSSLQKLRLEKGYIGSSISPLAELSTLSQLELVNVGIEETFADAIQGFSQVKKLLLIPVYMSEAARSNYDIISGVTKLNQLSHFYLGITNEFLRAMSLLLSNTLNSEGGADGENKHGSKECIPILQKHSSDNSEGNKESDTGKAEFISLSRLYKVLSTSLKDTNVKILKLPYHATWRQTIANVEV